jgi:hypothetical protein
MQALRRGQFGGVEKRAGADAISAFAGDDSFSHGV